MDKAGNPMSCNEEMQVKLSRYVDGEMTLEERAKVDDHLTGCEACRELLALFQKNENLLSNSLTTGAFGETVIASVVSRIRNEAPPEARPVEEGVWDWVRTRPLIQLAAAALLVVGLMVLLSVNHGSQMGELKDLVTQQQETLEETRQAYEATLRNHQEESARITDSFAQYEKLIRELRVDQATRRMPERRALAYIEPNDHRLVVKAAFNGEDYVGFHVYRAEASTLKSLRNPAYTLLTKLDAPLQVPLFMDMTAKPGNVYVYRFRALRREGPPVDSMPIQMRLPHAGNLSPEESIRVFCEEIAASGDQAKFRLERLIDGRRVSEIFYVNRDEPIGRKVTMPGFGEVDFSTGLVMSTVLRGTQTLSIRITEPVLDPTGTPIIYKLEDGTVIPATKDRDITLSVRPNLRAVLKRTDSADDRSVPVWRRSWVRVPADMIK